MKTEYIIGGILVVVLGAGGFLLLNASGVPEKISVDAAGDFLAPAQKETRYVKAPELVAPDGYINTGVKPITIGEFRGKKVVLIDMWTYSCINCQRTFPYLREWYAKYKDQGLEIVAVHTPEFAFEKVQTNVEKAAKEFGLKYPIVLDNEYMTWNAFGNQYWPRKYLIDIDGYIVYDHIGEGAYAETEEAIRRALEERAARLDLAMSEVTAAGTPEGVITVEGGKVHSPETYFGAWRNSNFGNGVRSKEGTQTLSIPANLKPNMFYLGGMWDFEYEYVKNDSAGAKILFVYDAKDVYFVASADTPVQIQVTRDGGQPLGGDKGADVNAEGIVTIHEDRLYKIVEGVEYGAHTLEIEILSPGLEAYTFTFG